MSSATPDPTNLYAGYPLQFHNNGRITRKLRGKLVYCGRWGNIVSGKMVWVDDVPAVAAAALEEWNRVWPYLRDGRTPPAPAAAGALTVGQLCNHFHATKEAEMERGKISARTFAGYHRACQHACKWLGKHAAVIDLTPDDIAAMYAKLAKGRNVVTQANYVRNLRMLFKHAYDPDGLQLIDRPVRMGKGFRQPVTTMLRRAEQDRRAKHGKRLLTEEELRALLDKATPIMRASILLGVNCGYGSADIAALETSHLDLTSGCAAS